MTAALRWRIGAGVSICLALATLGVQAAPVRQIQFSDTKLENGLRLIFSEDHSAPVFSIVVNYNVGSRDERRGRTGFAHLFEHMMFKGSENVGQNEHPYLIFMNGGSMNGTTNKDRTMYHETLPANQLDLALFLEADRMRSLAITKENLDNQINAVQEERRLGVDNQPYGKTFEARDELAYENFAYGHSVIGSMADLSAASVADISGFFKTYYAPNNAVVAIVGDVDTKATLAKAGKYFGGIARQPAPPEADMTEPAQDAERRLTLEDPLARLSRLDMAYKIPPGSSPDSDALSVLGSILSSGRSSRFYESIIRQKQVATTVNAGAGETRGPGLFGIVAMAGPGKTLADVEAAIEEEIERVKTGPIADWEMEKARTGARRSFVNGLGSALSRAVQLSQNALFYDNPGRINTRAEAIAKVTAADVQRVARQYLIKTGRTVVLTEPKAAALKGPDPMASAPKGSGLSTVPAMSTGLQDGAPQPSRTQMVLKGKAPVSNEILKVKLPRPQEADFPNGLHLMVLEDRRLPQIAFQIIIPGAGGYFDPADRVGLASYTASLMREGTKTRTSPQISEKLETMAAALGVSSGLSGTTASITGNALTENFDALMDLAADMLLHPAFAPEEWDRFKARAKAGFVQQRTNPNFLASETFNRVVFGSHPASRVSSSAANLDAITPEALTGFHRARYVPDHAVIALAGDISLAGARRLVEAKLGAWKKAGAPRITVTDPPAIGAAKVYLIARPNSVQTTMYVGTQSMTRTDPDYPALTVVNRVLGGTMGRLFRHLREEKGYTYGIGSGFNSSLYRGSWTSSTSVRTEVTEPALTDLLAEIAALRDTPVPESELADARRAIVGSFALDLESPQQVLGYYIDNWLYGLPADYWDTYPARVMAVTAAQAQAAAKKYWDPARLQIVAVGDAEKITDVLRKMGELEIYDADGKPIK